MDDNFSYLARSAFPLVWILVPAAGAFLRARRAHSREEALEIWQRWWAIGAFGIGSLWMTVAFLAAPDTMAEAIGFGRTPFMVEIAFANLGLAVMGFRAASASARERITIGLGGGMFLWGALAGHLYQWFANGDHAPGNTGGVLVNDLLIPAVMIALAVRSRRLAPSPRPTAPIAA
ncbi:MULTISPECIES: DUF6790 family protein [unclassified Streptomyces]|uniref:DUF6790 family protein n=1 Tax=unclassified Streptomyces TaxID=2593676 RepID=UPI00362DF83B